MLTTTVQGRTWNFSHAIGRNAAAGNGFTQPMSIACDRSDGIYVLSRGGDGAGGVVQPNKRIGKVTMDQEFLGDFGRGDFTWPAALAVDSRNHVYCSDEHEDTITEYDSDGEKLGVWGSSGSAEGELSMPSGITFDSENHLFIVDSGNHRVQKFTSEGNFISSWGTKGSGDGEFEDPWGITVDSSGYIYVADWGNNRVQKFSGEGEYIQSFGVDYPEEMRLDHPSDVAIDSEGDVYVVDWGNKRVQIFDSEGDILTCLYGDAVEFSKWAKEVVEANADALKAYRRVQDKSRLAAFERPTSIAIDENDRIIISESTRGRLQVYVKEKEYMDPQYNL
ncbi:MAG: SMP-30/gluconolactonase/LRE family protein [Chloroflexota bacterium]|nr:SMP-30/gluconolactonase/LRE family protein [Chloroflexota bacterium]